MSDMHSKQKTKATYTDRLDQESAWSAYPYPLSEERLRGSSRSDGRKGRQRSTNRPAYTKILAFCFLVAGFTTILEGYIQHTRVVAPLEQELLTAHAARTAGAVDSLVGVRTAAIKMAAGSLDVENLSASGGLDRLLGNLRELFPDFISLEIVNEQGQTVAMMGDITLPMVKETTASVPWIRGLEDRSSPVLLDDAAHRCFVLLMRHVGSDGGQWYSRTRFSRTKLTHILQPPDPSYEIRLLASPMGYQEGPSAPSPSNSARDIQSVKAPLTIPGWAVCLDRNAESSGLRHDISLKIPATLFIAAILFYLISLGMSRARQSPEDQPAAELPPNNALWASPPWPRRQPLEEFQASERSSAVRDKEDKQIDLASKPDPSIENSEPRDPESNWTNREPSIIPTQGIESSQDFTQGTSHADGEVGNVPVSLNPLGYEHTDAPSQQAGGTILETNQDHVAESNDSFPQKADELPEIIEFEWTEPDGATSCLPQGDKEVLPPENGLSPRVSYHQGSSCEHFS